MFWYIVGGFIVLAVVMQMIFNQIDKVKEEALKAIHYRFDRLERLQGLDTRSEY